MDNQQIDNQQTPDTGYFSPPPLYYSPKNLIIAGALAVVVIGLGLWYILGRDYTTPDTAGTLEENVENVVADSFEEISAGNSVSDIEKDLGETSIESLDVELQLLDEELSALESEL